MDAQAGAISYRLEPKLETMETEIMSAKKPADQAAAPEEPKRIGRPPIPPEMRRSGRLSMRTHPEVEEKAKRVGTEAVERAIMRIKEGD